MLISNGEVHVPSLVVNPAGCVEDVFRDRKVDHEVMLLGQPDGWNVKGDGGVPAAEAKEFTLKTEEYISHLRSLPVRVSGRGIQSLPGGGLLVRGGGQHGGSSAECGVGRPERFPLAPQYLGPDSCLKSLFQRGGMSCFVPGSGCRAGSTVGGEQQGLWSLTVWV